MRVSLGSGTGRDEIAETKIIAHPPLLSSCLLGSKGRFLFINHYPIHVQRDLSGLPLRILIGRNALECRPLEFRAKNGDTYVHVVLMVTQNICDIP